MRLIPVVIVLPLILSSCTTDYWLRSADGEVSEVIAEKLTAPEVLRKNELIDPTEKPGEAKERELPDLSGIPHEVGLRQAIAVATSRNRDYRSQKESLYISALTLTNVRNEFSFYFTGSLAAILTGTTANDGTNRSTANFNVSKILPTGGTAELDVDATTDAVGFVPGKGLQLTQGFTASLSQPLLRDAGYETSHEPLTQAERNVVYAIRDFELYRQDFTIGVVRQYYALVRQLGEIENAKENLKPREFLMQQSAEKFEVGLASEISKLRAEREYLSAKNNLLERQQAYQFALDRFKILLGLPTDFELQIHVERPEYKKVDMDLRDAIAAALNNRLDVLNAKDQVEDGRRHVRIATNQMLPDLDLDAAYGRRSLAGSKIDDQSFPDDFYTIGLTLELPFERVAERNALRRSMIDLARARRELTLTEDEVIGEVRESLRAIRRAEGSIDITNRQVAAAEKEAAAAQYRFEEGDTDNRNLTDAQNAVLNARNSYVRALVDFEVARIELYRDLGILFLDETGVWVEQ